MTLRIIHTADWQIGKPFRNFPPALAGELAAARLDVIGTIARVALEKNAAHVVVAGDVFDAEGLDNVQLRRALERLGQEKAVTWLLLPGNHDPARAGGLWDRLARLEVPSNVAILTLPAPYQLAPDAILLPSPLTSKNPGRDPSAWMAECATEPGTLRIGLAHGSVHGFDGEGESAVMIARDCATRAGLDYLALGDWHGARRIDARTWYSGTPEPDRFPDNEPGCVLAVTLDGRALPVVEKIASAQFKWARMETAIRDLAALEALEPVIARIHPKLDRVLLKLDLTGSLSLSDYGALDIWRERMMGKLRHLELATPGLAAIPAIGDFDCLGKSGPLLETARQLEKIAHDKAHPDSRAAELALVRLIAIAREAGVVSA